MIVFAGSVLMLLRYKAILPLMQYYHPEMAAEYTGPSWYWYHDFCSSEQLFVRLTPVVWNATRAGHYERMRRLQYGEESEPHDYELEIQRWTLLRMEKMKELHDAHCKIYVPFLQWYDMTTLFVVVFVYTVGVLRLLATLDACVAEILIRCCCPRKSKSE